MRRPERALTGRVNATIYLRDGSNFFASRAYKASTLQELSELTIVSAYEVSAELRVGYELPHPVDRRWTDIVYPKFMEAEEVSSGYGSAQGNYDKMFMSHAYSTVRYMLIECVRYLAFKAGDYVYCEEDHSDSFNFSMSVEEAVELARIDYLYDDLFSHYKITSEEFHNIYFKNREEPLWLKLLKR